MHVLYIGGTGEISYPCVQASVAAGQRVTVFNRGRGNEPLPAEVRQIVGDVNDPAAYGQLGHQNFDVICQFTAYSMADIERDLAVFSGRTGQYLFISTASAYRKPPLTHRLTEDVPLRNPFWPYSQAKADMETRLWQWHAEERLPVTVVRPSHTFRRRFPSTFMSGDDHAWRMLTGRAVISHGDGQSLWTLTCAADFAIPFVKLLGQPRALGEAFHIMTDTAWTWDAIFRAVGRAIGAEPRIVHVPSETLVRYKPQWAGPLLGDKSWSALFDTSKLQGITGALPQATPLDEAMGRVLPYHRRRMENFVADEALHALADQIAEDQLRLGTQGR